MTERTIPGQSASITLQKASLSSREGVEFIFSELSRGERTHQPITLVWNGRHIVRNDNINNLTSSFSVSLSTARCLTILKTTCGKLLSISCTRGVVTALPLQNDAQRL